MADAGRYGYQGRVSDSISSPDYWQERYDSGEDRWDKGSAAPPLLEYLRTERVGGDVLVPGCGAGHDVRALARQGARVVGLDFARGAIDRARGYPAVGSELYIQGDFFSLPPGMEDRFDWVFEHTCFCAIEPARRSAYVDSCARALRDGGQLLAIFYLDPRSSHEEGPPFGVTKDELDHCFGGSFLLKSEHVPTKAYPGREGCELVRFYKRKPGSALQKIFSEEPGKASYSRGLA